MSKVSQDRYIKFDFKMNESEYVKLKKAAWLGNVTMAEFIRDALNDKYSNAPELVRCKDCKHGDAVKNAKGEPMIECTFRYDDEWLKEPSWFCADGERKSDNA